MRIREAVLAMLLFGLAGWNFYQYTQCGLYVLLTSFVVFLVLGANAVKMARSTRSDAGG